MLALQISRICASVSGKHAEQHDVLINDVPENTQLAIPVKSIFRNEFSKEVLYQDHSPALRAYFGVKKMRWVCKFFDGLASYLQYIP